MRGLFCPKRIILLILMMSLSLRVFALSVVSASLEISPDDECKAYINGVIVFDSSTNTINGEWLNVYNVDVSDNLFCGDYVLAINYYDTLGTQVRISYRLIMHLDDGSTMIVYSDGTGEKQYLNGNFLLGTQTFPAGWNTVGFNDTSWTAPGYMCDGTAIADAGFGTGFVPNVTAFTGCWVPEAGQSVLIREPFFIQCPVVNIEKTINKNIVALGETITYCFNYDNTEGSAWTFNIWDTIPAVTDFVGCNGGCTTQTYGSNVVVNWSVTVPAFGSGSVCAWVGANRYPFFAAPEKVLAVNSFNEYGGVFR